MLTACQIDSAASYRRTLAPFQARLDLVPWLSRAEPSCSGVSEVLAVAVDGTLSRLTPTVEP